MRLFNSIAIVGTGLIGGSIALAAKKKKLCFKVIGVSRSARTLRLAKKSGAIDSGSLGVNIIKEADLVILATPVGTILDLAPKIAKIIKDGAVVTDVGSTKQQITAKLEKIFPKFVGSHPLAGLEKRGIDYADAGIFKGSLCILTPTKKTNRKALGRVKKLWEELGARVVFLNPSAHDKALSFVSHLPHILAFSLIAAIPAKFLRFAASGLKDTTRIAASDSKLWEDIFLSNRGNMVKAVDSFVEKLFKIRKAVVKKDKKTLAAILKQAKKKRETF